MMGRRGFAAPVAVNLLVAAALLWLVPGCGGSRGQVSFRELAAGTDAAYGAEGVPAPDPVLQIITDDRALADFAVEVVPGARDRLSGIDFSSEFVIAALAGSKETAGFAIGISRITQEGGDVIVQVALTEPQPGAVLAQVITSPYDIVSVRRADLDPRGSLLFQMTAEDGAVLARRRAEI